MPQSKKQYQISEDLFRSLCRYHLMEQQDDPDLEAVIRKELQDKLDRAAARERYAKEIKKNE